MNIACLNPALTSLVMHFGLGSSLVGVSSLCRGIEGETHAPVIADVSGDKRATQKGSVLSYLDSEIHFDTLREQQPDLVLGFWSPARADAKLSMEIASEISDQIGKEVKVKLYFVRTLDDVYSFFEKLGRDLGFSSEGHSLAGLLKAQAMDWADNFYSRMKGKRVSFLSSVEPLTLAGAWIPDLIHLFSAVSQANGALVLNHGVSWNEIVEFRPDVLVVAPRGMGMDEAKRTFLTLEKLPGWEDIPAVKRGEVVFSSGIARFYHPTRRLRESMGVLVSAIAGLESGYITERDSFFRLRYLEMHRHTL